MIAVYSSQEVITAIDHCIIEVIGGVNGVSDRPEPPWVATSLTILIHCDFFSLLNLLVELPPIFVESLEVEAKSALHIVRFSTVFINPKGVNRILLDFIPSTLKEIRDETSNSWAL